VNTTPTTDEARHPTLRYLPGLDGLRAISVLAVMIFHHYFLFGADEGWMPGGFMGVEVFFVVSGYLITSLLLAERRDHGRLDLKRFWFRRGRRLMPALWLLLIVVVAYSLAFLPDSIETLKGDVVAALVYVSNWWQIAADRSYAAAVGRPELLKHLWSLAIEEQFYLMWPPLLMVGLRVLGRKRMQLAMFLTAMASTILLAVISLYSVNFAYYATFTRLSGLLLGALMAFFFAPYKIRGLPGHGARIALDIAGACGLLYLLASFGLFRAIIGFTGYTFPHANTGSIDRSVFFGGFLFVDIATLLVIAAAVHPASDVGRLIGCRPLRWIGLRSYSLYLWHYPIMCITRPRVDFEHFFHLRGWPVFVLRMVLTFGFAELSYRFVEKPIREGAIGRYRERLRNAKGPSRGQLARRGIVIVASLSLLIVVLGMGLANAQPETEDFGPAKVDAAAPDPSIIEALRNQGTVPSTTVDTTPGKTTPTSTKKNSTTTTKPPPPPAQVIAIGDSVMQGAANALRRHIPGIQVDATKSRQFGEAVALVGNYLAAGVLPKVVIVHLGTNGTATDGAIDQIMDLSQRGMKRTVYFLTARVPRTWESQVNDTLHRGAQRWPQMRVLEWRDYAGCHDDWFRDGFHVTDKGQEGYGAFVQSGITGKPLTQCKK
jgi:peptidoglycan/LPS O-acetylase OafA/YrhL